LENFFSDDLSGLLDFLPRRIGQVLRRCERETLSGLTEIRLRFDGPVALCFGRRVAFLSEEGRLGKAETALVAAEKDMAEAWRLVTSSSVYALEEELKQGYITVAGGHRVGVAGTAVLRNGAVKTQKEITSLNYRFAREKRGVAEPVLPFLFSGNRFRDTLIFSPPGAGKTTLLRDLTRLLSDGNALAPPRNVAVVDERGEIAGVVMGRRRYDVGSNTDVLTGFPKEEGMMLALRSLSPAVLVSDEIGRREDERAVAEAIRGGVSLLLTAHAGSVGELRRRPVLRSLLADGVFECLLSLSPSPRPGTVSAVHIRKQKGETWDYVEMDRGPDFDGRPGLCRDGDAPRLEAQTGGAQ
jgi:stage III sporulation protein AA